MRTAGDPLNPICLDFQLCVPPLRVESRDHLECRNNVLAELKSCGSFESELASGQLRHNVTTSEFVPQGSVISPAEAAGAISPSLADILKRFFAHIGAVDVV